MFKRCLKEVQWVFEKFNGCLRKVSKVFQGHFKEVLRVLQGRLRYVPRDQGSFKGI